MPQGPLGVVIIGETGVGKSALVNLIAGKVLVDVSAEADICTKRTTKYDITIDSMHLRVWEIVGFNQPMDDKNPADKEISVIDVDLGTIFAHDKTAAVDVVLFCMRGERTREITTKIFDSVRDMFGDQVPIVLVINHLELEKDMEEWWSRNEETLRTKKGIEGDGHVCVTGLLDHRNYKQSQEAVLAQLRVHYEARGNKTLESIVLTYFGRLGHKKNLKEMLKKRYKIDQSTARRLVEALSPTNC
ncbi:hypothetical protein SCLCIDRAFT_1209771 [Scleroderma citrinum Foug A]|uniref:G domain-containing protein n=1 Tax=Scleroderma citrinum Foug A TaxID=1036808 RepID=A0A0C3EHD9_9AGAM|nr:hypothetical protein SCLCIDRAFT_1209771 [Scleroderma citrinum Foug A]